MKYFLTIVFVVLSTQLWAADDKSIFLCLPSESNTPTQNMQKLLIIENINGRNVAKVEDDQFELSLTDGNSVAGRSKSNASLYLFFESNNLKLFSIISDSWDGSCQLLPKNQNNNDETVITKKLCVDDPTSCSNKQLCTKGTRTIENVATGQVQRYDPVYNRSGQLVGSAGILTDANGKEIITSFIYTGKIDSMPEGIFKDKLDIITVYGNIDLKSGIIWDTRPKYKKFSSEAQLRGLDCKVGSISAEKSSWVTNLGGKYEGYLGDENYDIRVISIFKIIGQNKIIGNYKVYHEGETYDGKFLGCKANDYLNLFCRYQGIHEKGFASFNFSTDLSEFIGHFGEVTIDPNLNFWNGEKK